MILSGAFVFVYFSISSATILDFDTFLDGYLACQNNTCSEPCIQARIVKLQLNSAYSLLSANTDSSHRFAATTQATTQDACEFSTNYLQSSVCSSKIFVSSEVPFCFSSLSRCTVGCGEVCEAYWLNTYHTDSWLNSEVQTCVITCCSPDIVGCSSESCLVGINAGTELNKLNCTASWDTKPDHCDTRKFNLTSLMLALCAAVMFSVVSGAWFGYFVDDVTFQRLLKTIEAIRPKPKKEKELPNPPQKPARSRHPPTTPPIPIKMTELSTQVKRSPRKGKRQDQQIWIANPEKMPHWNNSLSFFIAILRHFPSYDEEEITASRNLRMDLHGIFLYCLNRDNSTIHSMLRKLTRAEISECVDVLQGTIRISSSFLPRVIELFAYLLERYLRRSLRRDCPFGNIFIYDTFGKCIASSRIQRRIGDLHIICLKGTPPREVYVNAVRKASLKNWLLFDFDIGDRVYVTINDRRLIGKIIAFKTKHRRKEYEALIQIQDEVLIFPLHHLTKYSSGRSTPSSKRKPRFSMPRAKGSR